MSESVPRLLIICHDAIGRRMAGPGIRAWETARILARQQPVTLIAPHAIDLEAAGLNLGTFVWGDAASLAPWLRAADVVLANGILLAAHPELATLACPLALDLYDPVIFESLELHRHATTSRRHAELHASRALLQRQLLAGDFFVCATERQRDLYLGMLLLLGRITPEQTDRDPLVRTMIDVASFGLPADPPQRHAAGLRGVVPGIGSDDRILLWSDGLWDWMDPLTLVEAMPLVAAHRPDARLVFLAGKHPGSAPPMQLPQRTRDRATELGLIGHTIFFHDTWVPYEQRADMLLDADLAVSLHRPHLETAYAAIRSRFLDHLWAGVASVVSAGDAAAALVEQHQLGRVAGNTPAAVAEAILALLDNDTERAACAARARSLATHFSWDQTLRPLAEFCRRPWIMRDAPPATPPARVPDAATAYRDLIARLDALWQLQPGDHRAQQRLLAPAKQLVNQVAAWYVEPIRQQQNHFNAATVQALQALAAAIDTLAGEQAPLKQHIADIERHLLDIDDAQTLLARRLASTDNPADTSPRL
ncbi:MAG TPA: glycosyl transferase family 1 [Roseiflexaceae bacterium]|nr:glycosyl transferase family 1 [Roseiflexaceae bacterium]